MSIIDQALKKTQQALNKNQCQPENKASDAKPDVEPSQWITRAQKKSSSIAPIYLKLKKKRAVFSILGLIALCLFILNFHPFHFLGQTSKKQMTRNASMPTLILNGTVATGKNHAALINHQLYQVGQVIDGFQITAIRFNEVDLKDQATQQIKQLKAAL